MSDNTTESSTGAVEFVSTLATESPSIPETSSEASEESKVDTGTEPESDSEGGLEAETKADEKDQRVSAKFAALARRERELRKREQTLREMESRATAYEQSLKQVKSDPLKFLEEHVGMDFASLTEFVLNGREETPEMKLRSLEERIREAEETRKREAEEQTKARERAALEQADRQIAEFQQHVNDVIEQNPDDFELIRLKGAHKDVFETIEEVWKRTGRVIPAKDAAQLVEDFLLEEERRLLTNSKKLGTARQQQSGDESSPRRKSESRGDKSGRRMATTTLSHERLAGSAGDAAERPLSRDESLKRAAKLLKWIDD